MSGGHEETPPPGVARHRAVLRRRYWWVFAVTGVVTLVAGVVGLVMMAAAGWDSVYVVIGLAELALGAYILGSASRVSVIADDRFDVFHRLVSSAWRPLTRRRSS